MEKNHTDRTQYFICSVERCFAHFVVVVVCVRVCLTLVFYLNFSSSSSDENFVETVVVAPRTQGLLSVCPAYIIIQLMNTVLMSVPGYVLLSFTASQKEGEN